ncbi:MAG: transposase [Pirellulaceae bacterium]|nr:transposase [Pirellulaceae bacterium]
MARQNRMDIFDHDEVGVYHCVQRAVRRAWLCGLDPLTGKSFEHRREWIQEKLKELAESFGIDCLSFTVMVNHVHVILRNRPDVVATWSDEEVAKRWWQLFPLRRDKNHQPAEPTEFELTMYLQPKRLKEFRKRLVDISWWMRALAEPIARRANKEDVCTGRFWEGRFKCQKLTDETAILACSAYVDLNPVRAGAAKTPEESRYTSAYERIAAEQRSRGISSAKEKKPIRMSRAQRRAVQSNQRTMKSSFRGDAWLAPIAIDEKSRSYKGAMPNLDGNRASDKGFLAMTLEMYLKLLDWTGRQLRADHKRGRIPAELEPILNRIGLSSEVWCDVVSRFGKIFKRVAGTPESLAREAKRRMHGYYQTSDSPLASPAS